MKRLFGCVLGVCCLLACERQKDTGCITGKVTFYNTGKVTDAYVRLMLSETSEAIYSGRIGLMGDYKIDNVEAGSYNFKVYKNGFIDTIFPEKIRIMPAHTNDGKCRQMDWTISMPVVPLEAMRVLDVNTNEPLDTLDFGTSKDRLYFKISNGNNVKCKWETDFVEVKKQNTWLLGMRPLEGTINAYSEQVISVSISRPTGWNSWGLRGKRAATFMIESNMGGWVMTVVANFE